MSLVGIVGTGHREVNRLSPPGCKPGKCEGKGQKEKTKSKSREWPGPKIVSSRFRSRSLRRFAGAGEGEPSGRSAPAGLFLLLRARSALDTLCAETEVQVESR